MGIKHCKNSCVGLESVRGSKNFVCSECNKRFFTKDLLVQHSKTHLTVGTIPCKHNKECKEMHVLPGSANYCCYEKMHGETYYAYLSRQRRKKKKQKD